jgi:hypothetical protein
MQQTFSRIITAVLYLLIYPSLPTARQATTKGSVNLPSDPPVRNQAIEVLHSGTTLIMLEPTPQSGYDDARIEDGKEGSVRSNYETVRPAASAMPQAPSATLATPIASAQCDANLWSHVYHPQRLIVKQQCISVTGMIVDATNGRRRDGVRHEADGDTHGWLKPDPEFSSLMNAGNRSNEGGNLVFEIVCKFPVSQADAEAACAEYRSEVQIPPVGSHVTIVGTYVQDTYHARWMEIHPVTSFTVIP